jgi:hypothetical protein
MSPRILCVALCSLVLGGGLANGGTVPDEAAQRLRIAREQADIEARFDAREQACQSRFAVTDCVEAARRERREALRPLREQSLMLDDADRRRRAAGRLRAIESRAEPAAKQLPELKGREGPDSPIASGASSSVPAASRPARTAREASPPRPMRDSAAKPPADPVARRQTEAGSRARFEARKKAIEARREEVERRNAQREKEGKRSRPLPVPGAASAP